MGIAKRSLLYTNNPPAQDCECNGLLSAAILDRGTGDQSHSVMLGFCRVIA